MEDSRNHIIQTASKLFLEKSYKAVTFQELKLKTGFSQGAFFYYFKNKQEIFEAVIDMFMNHFAAVDFTRLPQNGLRDFLDAYFPEAKKVRAGFAAPEAGIAANHYALIFEALRILPDFKSKVDHHESNATEGWIRIIGAARKNKEIKTVLSDEQLARLFIDAGHGILLHLIMTDNTTAIEKEALDAWNNLYLLIKK
jgi:TetR/AcrR family transcriptional regulator, transcriptional repressor for nem operon